MEAGVLFYRSEFADAAQAFEQARRSSPLFVQRGMQTWVLRADWKIGVLSRVVGRFDESIAQFRFTRKTAEELSLPAEAAHITLDLVESLLILERLREVPALCGEVSRYFRRAGKLRQALTAAAFLREAATDGTIRVATVQHVRRFVQQLERQPQLVFAPLPD